MSRRSISKDSMGFENIDEFWNSEALESSSSSSRRSSAASTGTVSSISSDANFDYDDDGSISDDDTTIDNSSISTPAFSTGTRSNFSTNEKLSSFNSMSIGSATRGEGGEEEEEGDNVDDDVSTDSFNNITSETAGSNTSSRDISMISHRESIDSEVAKLMSPSTGRLSTSNSQDNTPNRRSNLRKSTSGVGASSEKRRVSFGGDVVLDDNNNIDSLATGKGSSPLAVTTDVGGVGAGGAEDYDYGGGDDDNYGGGGGGFDDDNDEGTGAFSSSSSSSALNGSGIEVTSKSAAVYRKSPVNKPLVIINKNSNSSGSSSSSSSSAKSPSTDKEDDAITPAKGARKNKNRYSTGSDYTPLATPGSNDFPRGRQLRDETFMDDDSEEEVSDDGTDKDESFASETSYFESLKKKRRPDLEEEEEEEGNAGGRRSKRATKGQRFEYWKNERPVYDKGQMVGLLLALPTPKKGENPEASKKGRGRPPVNRTKMVKLTDNDEDVDVKKLKKNLASEARMAVAERDPPVVLPKNRKYLERVAKNKDLRVFSNSTGLSVVRECVSFSEGLKFVQLPVTETRPAGKEGVGEAASSFNVAQDRSMPAWMSGCVELPPGAIKDQEGTGDCTQVFFVSDCQPQSLELGVAEPDNPDWDEKTAQRHLLNKGDSFFILPNNFYRFENHSKTKPCIMNWVIINSVNMDEI